MIILLILLGLALVAYGFYKSFKRETPVDIQIENMRNLHGDNTK